MTPRTRIKICGIREVEHARLAAREGADAIGLVFHAKSPRCIDVGRAAEIAAALPPFVMAVGLSLSTSFWKRPAPPLAVSPPMPALRNTKLPLGIRVVR